MEQTVSAKNPLGTERIGKLMVRFAVPSIIALVVNSLYNMVDQIFSATASATSAMPLQTSFCRL